MDKNEFQKMQDRVQQLESAILAFTNPSQLDPQIQNTIITIVGTNLKLSDLSDVEGTDSATTGQVLKKTATTWQPGTDNIA